MNKAVVYERPFNFRRLRDYDYSRGASLFITITTSPRRALFGSVNNAKMTLSPFGQEIDAALVFTFGRATGFRLYGHVVMPDHIHFRIYLEPGVEAKRAPGLINTIVGRFKSYTNHLYFKKYGGDGTLWQESYHDWLCRGREMIDSVERYMGYNALKWWLRHGGGLALHEPLTSPRLGGHEYWRGLGAISLLDAPLTRVALRVSRRCSSADVAGLVSRLLAKAETLVVISGFISAGEREVERALLAHPKARLVKVSPYALAHDYLPPVSVMPAIAASRFAVIARGNSPDEISRKACLDLNARIIDIADHAAYAQPGRLAWLK